MVPVVKFRIEFFTHKWFGYTAPIQGLATHGQSDWATSEAATKEAVELARWEGRKFRVVRHSYYVVGEFEPKGPERE